MHIVRMRKPAADIKVEAVCSNAIAQGFLLRILWLFLAVSTVTVMLLDCSVKVVSARRYVELTTPPTVRMVVSARRVLMAPSLLPPALSCEF